MIPPPDRRRSGGAGRARRAEDRALSRAEVLDFREVDRNQGLVVVIGTQPRQPEAPG
jgi:hypothetical protein